MKTLMLCLLLGVLASEASLTIPTEMISALGVPSSMGASGMTAVKLSVGSRLLSMLGVGSLGSLPSSIFSARSKEFSRRRGPSIPTSFDIRKATPTEVENFFGVLNKVDANQCISRLVCEVGAQPRVLEGLGHNIKDAMASLQILEKNTLSLRYREILLRGQKEGFESCKTSFNTCDKKSYRLVRTFVKAFKIKN